MFGIDWLSNSLIDFGFQSLISLIFNLSHMQCIIDGFMNEILIILVFNSAMDMILLLFSKVQRITKAISTKKLQGKKEKNTINGLLLLQVTIIEVKLFLSLKNQYQFH